jgi:hypothetical protein
LLSSRTSAKPQPHAGLYKVHSPGGGGSFGRFSAHDSLCIGLPRTILGQFCSS